MSQFLKGRHILGGFFILIGSFYLYLTYNSEIYETGGPMETMDYPRFLIIAWLILSAIYIVVPREPFDAKSLKKASYLLLKIASSSIAFVAALPYAGFLCSSIGFLAVFFYQMGDRQYLRIIALSAISAILLWAVFEYVLLTPLPLGLWSEILY